MKRAARSAPSLSLAVQAGDGIDTLPAPRAQLRRWVTSALKAAHAHALAQATDGIESAELALRFVGRAEGLQLNRAFRAQRHATNVLTFPYADAPAVQADIVICVPVLESEAAARDITVSSHLAHLVVHGVLHACGHDHEQADEAERMEAMETRVLARLRIADPYAP